MNLGHKRNLGFEEAYRDPDLAERYASKHDRSATHRLRDRREQAMWRDALGPIGMIERLLDCPAGTGRFWSLLAERTTELHAADSSAEMLAAARARHPAIEVKRAEVAMAQELPWPDAHFDLVFSSRLLHHLPDRDDRRAVLAGLARVSSSWVAFSSWRTDNWMAFRVRHFSPRRDRPTRFFLSMPEIMADLRACDLEPVRVVHKQRLLSPLVAILARKL